jgi:ParB family chromosome partitioning protein
VDINEAKSAEISIIENLLREDLNIFEQAQAIESLIDTYELTQEQVAQKLSNSQSFVANKLRLLRFSQEERDAIIKNKLTERHARSLLRIVDPVLRGKTLGQIIKEGLNVADTEALIESIVLKKDKQAEVKQIAKSKAISSFYTTISKAIDSAKNNGVEIKSRKIESDNYTEISIILHKCNEIQE